MFADDVSLLSSYPNKEIAEAAMQETITIVAECSRCHKLTLNASKCKVVFFTNNSKEVHWQPSLQLDGAPINTTSVAKFLGVTIGRALSSRPYVAAVVFKASNRCQILASPTSKMWGWRKDQLLKVYQAIHLSVINYAAKTEHSGLSPSLLRL